jgi:membrane associated rhomboid family serine protease
MPGSPATITLLVVTALAYLGQVYLGKFHPGFDTDGWFALSNEGLHKGHVWQLITFQFMHGGFWHIFLNSWAIFVFGRAVEMSVGASRMLRLYFLSGVAGGLAQMLGILLLPGFFSDDIVLGASAGALGLVAAFAVLYPNQRLMLLLFFVIPLKMKARTLARLFVVMSLFGILLPKLNGLFLMVMGFFSQYFPALITWLLVGYTQFAEMTNNVAHAAHLGGIVAGTLIARRWIFRYREPAPPVILDAKSTLNITPARD